MRSAFLPNKYGINIGGPRCQLRARGSRTRTPSGPAPQPSFPLRLRSGNAPKVATPGGLPLPRGIPFRHRRSTSEKLETAWRSVAALRAPRRVKRACAAPREASELRSVSLRLLQQAFAEA